MSIQASVALSYPNGYGDEMSDTDYFAGLIAGADVQSSSRYFEPGVYLVEIDAVKFFKNRKRQPRAAVECTVLDSSNTNLGVSSSVSWIVSLDSDAGPSTIKTFLANVLEAKGSDITAEVISSTFVNEDSDDNRISPAAGYQCIVHAYEKDTKSGGKFTKCEWTRYKADRGDRLPDFNKARSSASEEYGASASYASDSDPIPF